MQQVTHLVGAQNITCPAIFVLQCFAILKIKGLGTIRKLMLGKNC